MTIRWNFLRLECFVAVADELSFTRAAESLQMTQPSVSAQVRRLEDELGLELFARSTRRVELTPAARDLLPDVRRLLAAADRAAASATALQRAEHGDLRVGVPPLVALTIHYPGVAALLESWSPGVRIHSAPSIDLLPALRQGHLDVAFLAVPLPTDGLVTHVVEEGELILVLPAEHPLTTLEVIPVAALRDQRVVTFGRYHNETLWDELVGGLAADGVELVESPEPSMSIMLRVALAGNLPYLVYPWPAEWMAEAMGMVPRRIEDNPCRYTIAVARRDLPPSPRLVSFWEAVVAPSEERS
jgi:DNA-binding transcriptional LysR family regulator